MENKSSKKRSSENKPFDAAIEQITDQDSGKTIDQIVDKTIEQTVGYAPSKSSFS